MKPPILKDVQLSAWSMDGVRRALGDLKQSAQLALTALAGEVVQAKLVQPRMSYQTPTVVTHGLGRAVHWRIVDINQNARVWRSQQQSPDPLNSFLIETDFTPTFTTGLLHVTLEVF